MSGSAIVPSVYLATPVICMNYMKRRDTLLFISLRCKGETEKPNCTLMESPYEIYSHTFSHISRPSRSTTWICSRAFSHEKKKSDNWTPSTDEGYKMCLNAADESQDVRHEFWGRRSRMDLEPRCCTSGFRFMCHQLERVLPLQVLLAAVLTVFFFHVPCCSPCLYWLVLKL